MKTVLVAANISHYLLVNFPTAVCRAFIGFFLTAVLMMAGLGFSAALLVVIIAGLWQAFDN